jgi:septum formation protein
LKPLVLASASASRAAILRGAGVAFEIVGAGVDETPIKAKLLAAGAAPRVIAEQLAAEKSRQASRLRPEALVIGADQTLELDGVLVDKAANVSEARARLTALRGRTHQLHAAVCAAEDGEVVWRQVESPALSARNFSDAFLDGYLARAGESVLASVGCYFLEGEGAQLFERIEGDYFAVLGLPLLPVLAMLRDRGALSQ